MKNIIRAILLAAFAFAPVAQAEGFYIGAGFGTSTSTDYEAYAALLDDGSFTSVAVEDGDTSMRFFVGYDMNENFAFEVGFTDLGEARTDAVSDGCCFYFPGAVTDTVAVDGIELSVVGKFPVGESFNIFGRLGMFQWDGTETLSDTSGALVGTQDGSDMFYGIGAGYDFNESFGITGEYTMYEVDIFDATALTLSVIFRFGN